MTGTESPGIDLLVDLEGVELLVIVDAAAPKDVFPPGAWRRIEYPGPEPRGAGEPPDPDPAADVLITERTGPSGHTLGVGAALELGQSLGVLPPRVWIHLVAGRDFGYGEELSPEVAAAIAAVADRIRADLKGLASAGGTR